jgi:predicted small metal-binding protein
MDKEICWRDIGLDCDLMVCGKAEDEVPSKAARHVLATHGIEGFSKEFYNKARSGIREGYCDYGDAEEIISEDCSACYGACFNCADEYCC